MVAQRNKRLNLDYKDKISDYITSVHEENILIYPGRTPRIYLSSEQTYAGMDDSGDPHEEPGVEHLMSDRFNKNMDIAQFINPGMPVLVDMKTRGGDWHEGIAIYDRIRKHPTPVTILNLTHARSMSSLIFLAANKRVMMPNSCFMFHEGKYGDYGELKGVKSRLKFYEKVAEPRMLQIYIDTLKEQGKFKNQSRERIEEMLFNEMDKKTDVFLTAQEAVEWGFADEIFDGNWDNLTKYTPTQRKRK